MNKEIVTLKVIKTLRAVGIHKSKEVLVFFDPNKQTNLAEYCENKINELYSSVKDIKEIKLGELITNSQILYFFNNQKIPENFEGLKKRSDDFWGILDYRRKEIILDNENAIKSFELFLKEIKNKPINLKFDF